MGNIIEFSSLDIRLLIPICNGFFQSFLAIIDDGMEYSNYPFMGCFMTSFSMLFAIIPYLIFKHNTISAKELLEKKIKKEEKEQNELFNLMPDSKTSSISLDGSREHRTNSFKVELLYNDVNIDIIQGSSFTVILVILIDFLQTNLSLIFLYGNSNYSSNFDLWPFQLIPLCLFSKFIAGTKIYNHQKISIIIICLLGVIINIIEFLGAKNISIILTLGLILKDVVGALVLSIEKKLLFYQYVSPYKLCFVIGLMEIIPSLLGATISLFFPCRNKTYCKVCTNENDNSKECYYDNLILFFKHFANDKNLIYFLRFFASIIFKSLINIFVLLTVGHFSPSHFLITIVIRYIVFYFKKGGIDGVPDLEIFGLRIDSSYIVLILYILISLVLLVYFEIVILKFCGLSYETKKNIIKRSYEDRYNELNEGNSKRETVSSISSSDFEMEQQND